MTFPIYKFRSIEIEQINDIRITNDRLFRNRARGVRQPYFIISLTSIPLKRNEYLALSAEVISYEGAYEIFEFNNPVPALSVVSGSVVFEQTLKGDKTIRIQSGANYQTGDFIQFEGSTKAYLIAGVTNSAGIQTIRLSCPLIKTIALNATVFYGADVVFQMAVRKTNSVQISTSKFGVIDVELIEQV